MHSKPKKKTGSGNHTWRGLVFTPWHKKISVSKGSKRRHFLVQGLMLMSSIGVRVSKGIFGLPWDHILYITLCKNICYILYIIYIYIYISIYIFYIYIYIYITFFRNTKKERGQPKTKIACEKRLFHLPTAFVSDAMLVWLSVHPHSPIPRQFHNRLVT